MGLFGKKEDPEDLMYQAMTFLEKNQPKAAVSLFKKVTKIDPENVNAWYNQGLALNQLKKYADAITCFDMITQKNPNDADDDTSDRKHNDHGGTSSNDFWDWNNNVKTFHIISGQKNVSQL